MTANCASTARPRVVIGISGASGAIYGVRCLQLLRALDVETHLVVSRAARRTIALEIDPSIDVEELADVTPHIGDVGAACASGSFRTLGMIVAPCSVRTLAAVSSGVTDNLLTRAADVTLKERRPLILMLRETPLHLGHIRNMAAVTEMGAIVCPPVPAFYSNPKSIDDLVDHACGRALDLLGLDAGVVRRWSGQSPCRDAVTGESEPAAPIPLPAGVSRS